MTTPNNTPQEWNFDETEWLANMLYVTNKKLTNTEWMALLVLIEHKVRATNTLAHLEGRQEAIEEMRNKVQARRKNLLTENYEDGVCNPRCHDSGRDDMAEYILSDLSALDKLLSTNKE